MPTGREILERAGVLLSDEEYVRWTLPELCDWLNEAQRAIVLAKPSACSRTVIIDLAEGTKQSVPQTGSPLPLMLLNIVRNVASAGPPIKGGRIITAVERAVLDAQEPYWHDPRRTPYRAEARHFIYDEAVPLEFYVYPGNNAQGKIEAAISVLPTRLEASGDENDIASYGQALDLPEPYSVPLLDYVLFRAQSKDDTAGNAGRATAHYQTFAAAVGLKVQVEGATSPNARRGK